MNIEIFLIELLVISRLPASMYFTSEKIMVVLLLAVTFSVFLSTTDAAYRKPPFNGSIFGKRTGTNGKAL